MADAAAPRLFDGLVFELGARQPLPDLGVAVEADIRHLLLENEWSTGSVRVVTVRTGAIFHRRMDDRGCLHLPGEILVTLQTKFANG